MPTSKLSVLQAAIADCAKCPRLRAHCAEVARVKRRAYLDQEYWGRPVPGFGDPRARVLIAGLAPGAHGANRTGRMFTGDRSGEWLYRALHENGFANQPDSTHRGDGLVLADCYITASARCAPPDNKPLPVEIENCRPWLLEELALLKRIQVVVALGRIAFDNTLRVFEHKPTKDFGHGVEQPLGDHWLISSYHPSQQNTSTGKLTRDMLHAVFAQARARLKE